MNATAQTNKVVCGCVSQDGVVKVVPERFHRIEFGGVSRQPFNMQPRTIFQDELLDDSAPMSWKPVPQEDYLLVAMAEQRLKETGHLRRTDSTGMYSQKPTDSDSVGRGEHCSDSGKSFPVKGLANDGGLSTGSPCGTDGRALRKSGFIQKSQPGIQSQSVFFTRGQRSRIQRLIAFSSRSLARRIGRWRLHPNCPRIRHVCGREYLTRQVFQITCTTRSSVHNSVEKPQARGPSSNASAISWRDVVFSRGFRPARPAPFNPDSPLCFQAVCHRLAVCRLTDNCRTTSAWLWPRAKSVAAVIRRDSNASKSRRGLVVVFMPLHYHMQGHVVTIL